MLCIVSVSEVYVLVETSQKFKKREKSKFHTVL